MSGYKFSRSAIPNPCHREDWECPERHEMCHSTCVRWIIYQAFKKAEKKRWEDHIRQHDVADRYEFAKMRKLRKMRGNNKN